MSDQGHRGEFERGGVWRRAAAILIDAIVVIAILQLLALVLFPLTRGRIQFADGIYAISCKKLDALPAGVTVPADFNANTIIDCHHSVFGLSSARMLRVARITQAGPITQDVHIDSMLDADGTPIVGLSLGILFAPLLLGWRFLLDGRNGTPGRRICRLRLANATDAGQPSAAAVRRRYGLLLVIWAPILVWSIGTSLVSLAAIPASLLPWAMLAFYSPVLIVALNAWWRVYRRMDTWYDALAGTSVLRVDPTATSSVVTAPTPAAAAPNDDASELARAGVETAAEVLHVAALPPPLPSSTRLARPSARQNYVARHWRGELSLPLSYWVNGTLIGVIAGVAIAAVAALIAHQELDSQPLPALALICAIWLFVWLLTLWQTVGIWRSATRYRDGGKRGWGVAAKVMVLLGVVSTLWQFVAAGLPQMAGIVDIVAGDSSLGPHQFKVLAYGEMLEFSGGIKFGVAQELDTFLNAMPDVKTLRLNSIGGRIREAQKMSDIVKARGLSTVVEKDCLSACTIVFLGGTDRAIMSNARLGFHQPSYRGITAVDRRRAIAVEEERLQKLGLSESFAARANKAEPGSMWFPDNRELMREHVVTRVVAARASRPAPPAEDAPSGSASADAAPAATGERMQDASASPSPQAPVISIPQDLMQRLKSSQSGSHLPSSITGLK